MALLATPSLDKHTRFMFAIQTDEGTEEVAGFYAVPFNDTLDFNLVGNMGEYRQADEAEYLHYMISSGKWWEGGAPIILSPGAGSMAAILSWIQDRDAYNQGKFATCFIVDDVMERGAMGVKVREARIILRKGEVVALALDLIGKDKPVGAAPAGGAVTKEFGAPYIFAEAVVATADYGDVVVADDNFESLEIRVDNHVEDGAEGLRLTESLKPIRLYNVAGIDASGTFERDYIVGVGGGQVWFDGFENEIDNPFDDAFDFAIQFVLGRGVASLTLDMPRCKSTVVGQPHAGSNEGRHVQANEFRALGYTEDAGATWEPPIVLAI